MLSRTGYADTGMVRIGFASIRRMDISQGSISPLPNLVRHVGPNYFDHVGATGADTGWGRCCHSTDLPGIGVVEYRSVFNHPGTDAADFTDARGNVLSDTPRRSET